MTHPTPDPTETTAASATDLMSVLRDSTRDAHQSAERRPLNRALARGTLTRPLWIAHLEQLLLLNRALEARIDQSLPSRTAWTDLIAGRRRVPDLEADLRYWQGSVAPDPLPATAQAVGRIAAIDDHGALGMLYVLEGSTNGGRFLAKSVARGFGLPADSREGLRSLDPYGEQQPARWASFKTTMNTLPADPSVISAIQAGAQTMFEMVGDIADDVWATA